MDDIVQVTNPNGKVYDVRFGNIMKVARIHLGLAPFDEFPEKVVTPNMEFYQ